jgi:hypothetical protein
VAGENSTRRGEYVNPDESNATVQAVNERAGTLAYMAGIRPDMPVSASDNQGYTNISITPRESAYTQLDQEMMKLFGRRATQAEKSEFYRQLNKLEKQYSTRGGAGGSTGYQFDKGAFIYEYTTNLAKGELQAGKQLGGTSGQLFRNIKSYADNMGIPMSDDSVLGTVLKIVNGEKDETTVMEDFRQRSISLYAGLADRLNANPELTVREAASDYIELMGKYFDMNPNNVSLFDSTLTKAINFTRDGKPATKTMSEFIADLRSDDRFQYGTMAHEEARNLGSSIARMMI